MNKEMIKNSYAFRKKCSEYGLDYNNFDILDDVIVVNTPDKYIKVLLDEEFNVVSICDFHSINEVRDYEKFCENRIQTAKFEYDSKKIQASTPFINYTLKNIVELSNRIDILPFNNGHNHTIFVGNLELNASMGNDYIALLMYIKFLGNAIESYLKTLYHLKLLGIKSYNVHSYVDELIFRIEEFLMFGVKSNQKIKPIHVVKHLGLDSSVATEYEIELIDIINLLTNNENIESLEEKANELLKLLDVSYKETKNNLENIETLDLEEWLKKQKVKELTNIKK